jgi:hypothetical protein
MDALRHSYHGSKSPVRKKWVLAVRVVYAVQPQRALPVRLSAAHKHLIPGSGISSNRHLRINRLR